MESINSIKQDMYEKKLSIAEKGNYAIYGHSMGASVGFELIHQLLENGKPAPLHFFATGATGPSSLSRQERNWHHLPKNELIDKLRDLQGCPDEIFEDSDLLDFLLPIIRSDFKAVETFRYTKRPPLEIPISVVTGTEEPLKDEEVALWQNETAFAVNFQKMNGGHFFINACATSVVNHIAKTIRNSKIN
jgi:surfactin synthase thioesterase subunit